MLNDVGEAARTKAVAPLGDAMWHPNERVERVEPIVMRNAGVDEEMFLIYTTSENILKARVNGRILLAWSPDDTDGFEAGAFWVTEYRTKRLQSIYVDPLFRPQAGNVLASALKRLGVKQTVGPYSPAGQAYVDRHRFKKVSNMYRRADLKPWSRPSTRINYDIEDAVKHYMREHYPDADLIDTKYRDVDVGKEIYLQYQDEDHDYDVEIILNYQGLKGELIGIDVFWYLDGQPTEPPEGFPGF